MEFPVLKKTLKYCNMSVRDVQSVYLEMDVQRLQNEYLAQVFILFSAAKK